MAQDRAEAAGRHLELAEKLFGTQPEAVDLANLRRDQARHACRTGNGERGGLATRAPHSSRRATRTRTSGGTRSGRSPRAWRSPARRTRRTRRSARRPNCWRSTGHRRDVVEAYRAWGKFLRRAGREDDALEVFERAADLASEPLTVEAHRTAVISAAVRPRGPFSLRDLVPPRGRTRRGASPTGLLVAALAARRDRPRLAAAGRRRPAASARRGGDRRAALRARARRRPLRVPRALPRRPAARPRAAARCAAAARSGWRRSRTSLLRAVCGQLIQASRARAIERQRHPRR